MRLIDADALELFIATVRKRLHLDHTLSDILTRDSMLLNFQQYVHLQPTIDAVPAVRGEWVVDECDTTDDVPSSSWIDFHCSECNTDYGLEEGQYGWCRYKKIPYQYCPTCGAKMGDKP